MCLDETGTSLALTLLYGWGRRGAPLLEAVPFKRGESLSVLGALSLGGMVATAAKRGAFTREDFERFLEADLLPKLAPGCVLVLDNASIHKGRRIAALAEQAGCELLYLPPYSPDLNPIELVWAWVKRRLRKLRPRDPDARQRALAQAIAELPPQLPAACFRHCGYLQP